MHSVAWSRCRVLVITRPLCPIIRLFVHSLNSILRSRVCREFSKCASVKSGFAYFRASGGLFSCFDSSCLFYVCFRFLGFSCIRCTVFRFLACGVVHRF